MRKLAISFLILLVGCGPQESASLEEEATDTDEDPCPWDKTCSKLDCDPSGTCAEKLGEGWCDFFCEEDGSTRCVNPWTEAGFICEEENSSSSLTSTSSQDPPSSEESTSSSSVGGGLCNPEADWLAPNDWIDLSCDDICSRNGQTCSLCEYRPEECRGGPTAFVMLFYDGQENGEMTSLDCLYVLSPEVLPVDFRAVACCCG